MEKKVLLAEEQPEFGAGFLKALTMSPADVVNLMKDSGIRGRGGAGFPVGFKWELASAAVSEVKFVVCNADEGEPGTFKDRVLLENYSERLIEGMAVAGYSIGSSIGIIYLRAEYSYLMPVINKARERMTANGLLGKNIQNTEYTFDVEIRLGAGAYVCGEETALLESLEGKSGLPRNKPPYPVTSGYQDMPTVVNNVETLCAIPHIVLNGAHWYAELGLGECSGTKLFSVSGDVERPGVYELSMGSPLKELLGLAGAVDVQAVQVGGASGRTVSGSDLDQPLSFKGLPPGGSVIVFNNSVEMMGVLENFMEFFVHESCGQCTPCREGLPQLQRAVQDIVSGDVGSMEELKNYFTLTEVMKATSKCGLGQTAANCFVDIVTGFAEFHHENYQSHRRGSDE
ncbi:MAG: SLBB domain-containing protein [Candidatus Sabulitectum sp.]|nr:SLBB domain-containing protein [Candidatus Sabulitectum sp.]